MKKRILYLFGLIGISFFLISWGSTGHRKINRAAGLSFNTEMTQFSDWISILETHSTDADTRKNQDPTEGPKHYIDIDNYNEFITKGRIPQTLDSVIAIHGYSFVYDNGILPWATITAFDSLKNCFERHDWDKAVLFASDLGHYVADGHMPLHVTKNYDGQNSGNNGIHSRYETTMINAYISQFNYEGMETIEIQDIRQYIFDYLYPSCAFVSSVLAADNYAKSINSSTSSAAYKQALWEQTQSFTIPLFKNASHALSELIYTAWVQAGKPSMTASSVSTLGAEKTLQLEQIAPNPVVQSTRIKFNIHKKCEVHLQVLNSSGQLVATLVEGLKEKGSYAIDWAPANLPSGIYYIFLKSGQVEDIKKIIVAN